MDYFELLLFKNYLKHLNAYSNSFTIVNIFENLITNPMAPQTSNRFTNNKGRCGF